MFIYDKIILYIIMIFLFVGCSKPTKVQESQYYSLDECKKELLNADDYIEKGSIDFIIVEKKERKMYLYKDNKIQNILPISLGKNSIGHKEQKGDYRTPEGTFWLHRKLCSPKYYRSLCISYPSTEDVKIANKKGLDPGGDITIHAQPKWNANGEGDQYTLSRNWTRGCMAVTNSAMNQLWYAVREGVPVIIR